MARPKASALTERESEIMAVLWELQSGTAEEVRALLSGDPHDSTVRTLLRVLVSKGHVVADKDSRPAIYRPAVKKRAMQKQVARDLLLRFFSGSAEDLVLQLLDDQRLSPQQLKKIEAAYRRKSKGETET
ncbi:BlaI/MecI/CopY family transcriptional regulator [Aeoliella sp. ICT_H6.2]|uniref:BlaI/MecI/CopY family transcriptional regulator n=1 Tax=Aeoliella straminimaris TaxID=2954799 RepID=A0A9X2JGT0_9BACT|nr:BlaI/MecI/CopY family transcriptional regulator [Aeoliella straminimaris]MCO6045325.1 BlaI/MecI/CopY family transcriptional regulator [Aeoliella straminimaris]